MKVYKHYETNQEKYPWIRLNPKFAMNKRDNHLKWGNSSATIEREDRKSFYGQKRLAVMMCFYEGDLVKTYETNQKPTTEWVNECVLNYFDSRELDKIIKEPYAISYALMLKKYKSLE